MVRLPTAFASKIRYLLVVNGACFSALATSIGIVGYADLRTRRGAHRDEARERR